MHQIAWPVFGIHKGENTKPMILFIVSDALSFPVPTLSFALPQHLHIKSLAFPCDKHATDSGEIALLLRKNIADETFICYGIVSFPVLGFLRIQTLNHLDGRQWH
jgi:hypothetical protein